MRRTKLSDGTKSSNGRKNHQAKRYTDAEIQAMAIQIGMGCQEAIDWLSSGVSEVYGRVNYWIVSKDGVRITLHNGECVFWRLPLVAADRLAMFIGYTGSRSYVPLSVA